MTFRSSGAEQIDPETYRITGDLTIKDVTKPLTIDLEFHGSVTDVYGMERVGFEGSATILRSDWGLTWNAALETGGVMVSDKVRPTFDISAVEKAPEAARPQPHGTGATTARGRGRPGRARTTASAAAAARTP